MNIKKLNEIKATLSDYDKIITLVENTLIKLQKIDAGYYYTYNNIISSSNISFYDDMVSIKYDKGMDYYDFDSLDFPIEYLTMDDDELRRIVLQEKEERTKAYNKSIKESELEAAQDKENQEIEQYLKLKEKYEDYLNKQERYDD